VLEALGLAANERPDLELAPSLWPRTMFPNLLEEFLMWPWRLLLLLLWTPIPLLPLDELFIWPELAAVLYFCNLRLCIKVCRDEGFSCWATLALALLVIT